MSSPQHEPTMEEILASIRKIISEDSNEAAPAAAAPAAAAQPAPATPAPPVPQAPAAAPVPEAQPDVLELTQEFIAAEPAPPEPPPAPEPKPPVRADNDVVFESDAPKSEVPVTSEIFSDTTRQAIDSAFSNIPEEAPPPARARMEPLPAPDGASIESVFERAVRESFEPVLAKYLSENSGAVIDRMKPLIREWMDENFPALLDQAVRAEVERVVKARRR